MTSETTVDIIPKEDGRRDLKVMLILQHKSTTTDGTPRYNTEAYFLIRGSPKAKDWSTSLFRVTSLNSLSFNLQERSNIRGVPRYTEWSS